MEFDWKVDFFWVPVQATVGPCNAAKPGLWNVVEHGKWTRFEFRFGFCNWILREMLN